MVSGYSSVTNFNNNVFDSITIVQEEYNMPTLRGAYIVVEDNKFGHFERLVGESKHAMKKRMKENHVRQATLEEISLLAVSFLQQRSLTQIQRNKILNIVSLIETAKYDKWNDLPNHKVKFKLAKLTGSYEKLTNGLNLLDRLLEKYIIKEESILRLLDIFPKPRGYKPTEQDVSAITELLQKTVSLYTPFAVKSRRHGRTWDDFAVAKPYQIMLRILLEAETQELKEAHAAVQLMLHVMPQENLIADTDELVCEALRNDNLPVFEELINRGTKLAGEALKHAVQYSGIKTLHAVVTHVKKRGLHKSFSVGFQEEILSELRKRWYDSLQTNYELAFEHFRVLIDQDIINTDQINVSSFLMRGRKMQWIFLSLPYLAKLGVDLVFYLPRAFSPSDLLNASSAEWKQCVKYTEIRGAIGIKPTCLREGIDDSLKHEMEKEGCFNFIEFNNILEALYELWDALERGYQTRRQVYERVVELVRIIGLQQGDTGKIVMEYLFGDEEVQISNMPKGAMEYFPIKLHSGNPEANQKSFKYAVGETELTRMTILSMYPPA